MGALLFYVTKKPMFILYGILLDVVFSMILVGLLS